MRQSIAKGFAQGIIGIVMKAIVVPERIERGRHVTRAAAQAPERGDMLIANPERLKRVSRLYCGLVRERGTVRTSTTSVTSTLRADVPLQETPADLEWQGAHQRLKDVCHQLGDEKFPGRVPRWRKS